MPVAADLLHKHPLLGRLSAQQILAFAQLGELEVFRPGEDIVVEGTVADSLYLILSGHAHVIVNPRGSAPGFGREGAPPVGRRLASLMPGEFFGEMSLCEPAPRSATVRAIELTEVFRIPHFAMQNLLQDDPLAFNVVLVSVVRVLSQRLRKTNEIVGSIGLLSEWLAGSMV
jgi:CRP-like cAMP-binding protein